MDLHYSASVEWSDDDDEFVALCPEFPGASGSGETPDAAIAELQESIAVLLDVYADKGVPAPVPHVMEEYSGQVRLRMPKELHRQLVRVAERQEVSLNTLLINYLASGVARTNGQADVFDQLKAVLASHQQFIVQAAFASPSSTNINSPPLSSPTFGSSYLSIGKSSPNQH